MQYAVPEEESPIYNLVDISLTDIVDNRCKHYFHF